jgi:hypothetical protein
MAKKQSAAVPQRRVEFYPEPTRAPAADPVELARQRAQQERLYAQWRVRWDATQERDRRTRRILTRIAVATLAVAMTVVTVVGWQIYHAVSTGSLMDLVNEASTIRMLLILGSFALGGGGLLSTRRRD